MPAPLREILKTLGIVTLLAAGFTWFNVYGSGGSLWLRFLMWFITMLVGAISSIFVVPFVFDARLKTAHPSLKIIVAAALLSVPVTFTLMLFMMALGNPIPLVFIPIQFGYVFAVSLVITVGGFLMDRAHRLAELEDAQPEDRIADFLQRLPVRFRGADLWAISSEDHYLRVHTDRGEELILMRLADAIRELGEDNGLQTHRSWWVAKQGVADSRRENGKLYLVLKSGKEAPVSRTYQPNVRAAGLT